MNNKKLLLEELREKGFCIYHPNEMESINKIRKFIRQYISQIAEIGKSK